jgi:hypothetical protein
MATQGVQLKGVLHWLIHWAFRADTRDFCSALAAVVIHYFNSFVLIAQQVGQAVMLDRLSLSMCLWTKPTGPIYFVFCRLYPISLQLPQQYLSWTNFSF